MAWEYLETAPFYIRYQMAAAFLKGKTKGKRIVDVNCGWPGFYQHVPKDFASYHANDLRPVEIAYERFHFQQIKDEDVDQPCDILALFGYGGGAFTGHPMESHTEGATLDRLAWKYLPEFIIVEMAQKWETEYQAASKIAKRLPEDYHLAMQAILNILPLDHYHNMRLLTIFQR